MIVDELISSVSTAAALLVVGGAVALLAFSWRRRADQRWKRIFVITSLAVLAVLVLAALAFVAIVTSDDPRWRF